MKISRTKFRYDSILKNFFCAISVSSRERYDIIESFRFGLNISIAEILPFNSPFFFFSTAISISEIRVGERCESPPRNSDAVMNLFDPTFFTDIYTPLCLPWQGLMPAGNDVMRPNYFCKSCKYYSIPSCPRETLSSQFLFINLFTFYCYKYIAWVRYY